MQARWRIIYKFLVRSRRQLVASLRLLPTSLRQTPAALRLLRKSLHLPPTSLCPHLSPPSDLRQGSQIPRKFKEL